MPRAKHTEEKKKTGKRLKNENKEIEKESKEIEKETKKEKKQLVEDKKEKVLSKREKELLLKREEELETIRQEIREESRLPKEDNKQIESRIFKNILFGIVIIAYFICIKVQSMNLEPSTFIQSMKISSLVCGIITILVFEIAYKKDSGSLGVNGIELMCLAIASLLCSHINIYYTKYLGISITLFSLAFAIYYVIKSMVMYIKTKKKIKTKIIQDLENE